MNILYKEDSTGVTDWQQSVGRPLRTAGCLLFLCTAGRAVVSVNMQKKPLRCGSLLVVTQDMFAMPEAVSVDFAARYVSLSDATLWTAYYRIPDTSLWGILSSSPVLFLGPHHVQLVADWFSRAAYLLTAIEPPERTVMLGYEAYNLFSAIGVELARHGMKLEDADIHPARFVTNRFWALLMRHSPHRRDVKFYANALNITPDYLYKVCRSVYGTSPKALIDQQLTVEIRTLLADTDMSVKEIAARFCFEDDSYLCRFFRRNTGLSPMEFRLGRKSDQWRNVEMRS
ncbi:helix-turn-helix transcriptional regulator [Prevotella sp. PCHR]|uniref:Helix-turn-helix transcriptional regulator n=1 Tax=Xylanibacter caecicola TaxID=2736294 RepID=A0ABX2B2L0_9BACT|nr:AraC family transcriptional regulator [Xylanibacter caecicola]NPE25754.1 helix-turn-helix transcriptional regulator [Xylanibacter caecicola]